MKSIVDKLGYYMDDITVVKQMVDRGIVKCRLSELSLAKCKRFQNKTTFKFEFPLTVLVGQNGSGKTTAMRAVRLLNRNYKPKCEFFETEIDNGGLSDTEFEYVVDGQAVSYSRSEKTKDWIRKPG